MTSPRILIIDDESDIAEALRYSLQIHGFDAKVVYDGQEGLEAAKEDPPDLLLLDVMLPGCNGYEISRQLKDWMEASPVADRFPILLITARRVGTPEREEFLALWSRADDVLYKPFELEDLVDRCRDIMAESADSPQERAANSGPDS